MNLMGSSICTPRPSADVAQRTCIDPSWKPAKAVSLFDSLEKTADGIPIEFRMCAALLQYLGVKQKQMLLGIESNLPFWKFFRIDDIR
jgi:hypothetical protein